MAARGRIPPAYEKRPVQAPGMIRHGPFPELGPPTAHFSLEPLPPPELLENKIAAQAAEIEQLASDNHRFAASHVALRQELVAAGQEVQRLKAHIRSIQTESDIQIRVLQDKIAKKAADIRAGENVKTDLQKAHTEAQSLVKARQELTGQIQQASQELQKALTDVKNLPNMLTELGSLRKEHQRLHATFEYEKRSNIEQVEQMQTMEKSLIGMAREVEKLRAEVLNAENRAHVPTPHGGGYINPDPSYPPVQAGGAYIDVYGRPLVQMGVWPVGQGTIPFGSGPGVAAPSGVGNAVASAGGSSSSVVWGATYDPSLARR